MEQNKSSDEPELTEVITTEYTVKHLVEALEHLLHGKNGVDEHKAKQLRKNWETLQKQPVHDSVDLSALENGFEQLRQRVHKQVEQRNKRYAEIEQYLEKLIKVLKADDLQTAQQLEQKIIASLNSIRDLSAQRRQKIIGELEAAQPKIKKLSSWRHWSTEQAREKIIEEISNLHETEKDLEKIAKRIQQAREEWKRWDHSGEGGNKKLYARFDRACSKAYEPCKALFEAKRKQRQSASRLRTEVCEMLEKEYEQTDWRQPDWKQLQKLIREHSSRWRKLGAAEFRDRKPLQKRFDAIITKFDGPLDRERKQNYRQRLELIEEINKLTEVEDNRRAINELQTLKNKWLVSVSGDRNQEQKVWKQFVSACDAIYEKSRSAKKAFDQELKQQLQIKQELCSEIDSTVADDSIDDADNLTKQIKQWNARWSESGRVPKSDAGRIEKQYREAISKATRKLQSLNNKQQFERDQLLFRTAEKCASLEKIVFESSALQPDDLQPEHELASGLDASLAQAFEKRFSTTICAGNDNDQREKWLALLAANYQKINEFLVLLEINAGIDSPSEHAKHRMALQIGRLSAAMGKASEQAPLDAQELINRIHTTGAVTPDQQSEINQRFKCCYQAIYHEQN